MKIRGFVIMCDGDPDVGIQPGTWTIDGGFEFEDENAFDEFRFNLFQTFELQAQGTVEIKTFEEIEEENRALEKQDIIPINSPYYYILSAGDHAELTEKVNNARSHGWEAQGGVQVSIDTAENYRQFFQAIVRRPRFQIGNMEF